MAKVTQILKLKDGRRLAFDEYGDLTGKPLFYFHGWPSSRIAARQYNVPAKKLRIRIISADRPGFGLSEFQKNRTLLDWPKDVKTLADHLKIDKFSVMGVSGGGPYAAACAYKLRSRVTKVGIVAGLGPIFDKHFLDGVLWMSKVGWLNFDKPVVRRVSAILQYFNALYGFYPGLHRFFFMARNDKKVYRNQAVRKWVADNFREAFRQGYKGPEWELKLYVEDWGYHVSKIRTKTYLWYGQDDKNVSIIMGNYYHTQIIGSKLTTYPAEGHLISITHAEEIIKTLTS